VQGNWLESTVAGNAGANLAGATADKCVLKDNEITSASTGVYVGTGATNNRVVENHFLGAGASVNTSGAGSGNTTTPNY
jgi:nitrous oxidase accessory protein NosD